MKYQAKPIIVDAVKITAVTGEKGIDRATITTEDGHGMTCPEEMTARMWPVEGDYLVTQPDGYEYLNPKAVFESKYSPIEGEAA